MRRQAGFTLMELMVAISIFGLLATLAYSGLASVLDANAITERQSARLRQLQRTFLTLDRDLDQLVARGIRDDFGDRQPAFVSDQSSNQKGQQLFELTRGGWRNPTQLARSDLQRVRYVLRDKALWRERWSTLDRAPESHPVIQRMIDQVLSVRLRYLDSKQKWQQQWPPLSRTGNTPVAVPLAVEIEIETEDYGSLRRLFVTTG